MRKVHVATKNFKTGEFVFKEGDAGDCAYIIDRGQIQLVLTKDDETLSLGLVGPGDIIGEMAILDGLPRSASAVVIEDCTVSVVSKTQLVERLDSLDPIVRMLISLLLKRLRSSDRQLSGLAPDVASDNDSANVELEKAKDRIRLETELLQGLQKNEFFLNYQPIINIKDQTLNGFEALVRWKSPTRGLVKPDDFIGVAEQTSLIIPIGSWILDKAFEDLNVLQSHYKNSELTMSINVSSRQFNDRNLIEIIEKSQKRHDINPRNIKLEVTERVFQEGPIILDSIDKCRKKGYTISLDDFGTGYSSLGSLFNLNVDQLKIDKSFVQSVVRDHKSRTIIKALIQMAINLGLEVVAEGIETHQQAYVLGMMGCKTGQGYLFGMPTSLEEIINQQIRKAA
jgi:diguanylate cyclase